MILPFVTELNEILKQPTTEVTEITPEIKKLCSDMLHTMRKYRGIGLAANQLGLSHKIAVVEAPRFHKGPITLINPTLTFKSEEVSSMVEGCLSIPKRAYMVQRPLEIEVEYLDKNGKTKKLRAKGILARIIQHEVSHLEGRLIEDEGRLVKEK